jgi:mono/diheme cytochrome c family protein
MRGPRLARITLLCLPALILGGLVSLKPNSAAEPQPPDNPLPPAASKKIGFNKDIKPILAKHCVGCHGPKKTGIGTPR